MESISLDDNLILRTATADDREEVAEFNSVVMAEPPEMTPEPEIGDWTRDLFDGVNRRVGPSDFTVVEDTKTGKIVSTIVYISQVWNMGGVDVPMGMPEIVGTHPDYRRRGLILKQFDVMHEWGKERGHLFNTVMGIPYYYKQFGYEYALDAWGGRATSRTALAGVLEKKDSKPPFTARDAKRSDVPFIAKTELHSHQRLFVTAVRDAKIFEREMFGCREGSMVAYRVRILERDGEPVGYYIYDVPTKRDMIRVDSLEITDNANWLDATSSMLVDLKAMAEEIEPVGGGKCEKIEFEFGSEHPALNMFDTQFGAAKSSYAWVVRVPDVAALVSRLTPVIEKRLAESDLRGWSGDLKISFYRSGLQMKFDGGKLGAVENTGSIERHDAQALYPDLSFTKALFGQHSFTQLRDMYSDCFTHKRSHHVLQDILWGGQQASGVLPTN
ncbi:GNAT family N-acetyltransferase [Candidatus Lucifugimonas marina]|uniref:GNAT family N-acetyltransferase n=1 Tax=Candidatus Lucifugimonas marina TaxID=3038979 RepID=A0AAJ5ZEQ8_9CHLR|nr:GNAT family N-acetyltransferase [SAR202 cluster bacterium JH639]WFG35679.1 GNAT family N-acetyltransferase [SAR202 cluster bacterium JH545]WFG39625.1 GNAT family N-acetyltransferase [SAR202 cluster bacterium JH1073]